jgi:drug/metabolite transporter (DMT)-like permease
MRVVPKSRERRPWREGLRRAYLYTTIAVVVWTTGPVGAKAALLASREGAHLTPMQVSFWPVALGWIGLVALLIGQGRARLLGTITGRGWAVLVAMGLSGWVGYQVALNMAYVRLNLAEALIISYLNPIFVVLFQGRLFGAAARLISGWEQRPEVEQRPAAGRLAIGLALGLLGVAVIATGGRLGEIRAPHSATGAVLALCGAMAWGIYSNLGRFVRVRPGMAAMGLADVQNVAAMAVGLGVMAAVMAGGGALRPPIGFEANLYLGRLGPAHVSVWVPIIAMAALNYAVGYTLWLRALEDGHRLGQAHKLPPLTYGTLALAIAGGWLVLREPVGAGFWQGAALIAAGNLVTLWPERSGERGRKS